MGGDDDEDEEMEIDETPEEDVVEETPKGRNRPGGMGARSRARTSEDDQTSAEGDSKPRSFRNRPGSSSVLAKKQAAAGNDEDKDEEEDEKEKETEKKKKEEEEEKKEEPEPTKASKKEPPYPEWWKTSYPRSAISGLSGQFVGDQPLFPECPYFDASATNVKTKRFGLVEPPRYVKNSRNPCWFEWNGKKDLIKCLPYFYIAGAPKSGTADLYNRLRGHPNILIGGGPTYSWWDRLRYGASKSLKYTREARRSTDGAMQMKEYAKDVVGKHGKNLTKEVLYFGESFSIIGDATPTYLTENTQWDVFEGNEGCSEPRVLPATFIRHVFPQARMVLLLRDPVDRLYSRFLASVPYVYEYENHTSVLFHTFVTKAVQTYRECFARLSIRHCAYNTSLFTTSVVRLSEGMYSVFVEDWLRIFSRDQLLFLKFEEYANDVQGHLRQVFQHLGVDPIDDVSVLKLAELPVVRKGRTGEEVGFIKKETLDLLEDFYNPFNLRLADLLGDDKWQFQRDDTQDAAVDYTPAFPVSPFGMGVGVGVAPKAEQEGVDSKVPAPVAETNAQGQEEAESKPEDDQQQQPPQVEENEPEAAETETEEAGGGGGGGGGGEGEENAEAGKEENADV